MNLRPPIIEPCPWKRLCHCTHTAPCEGGQIAGAPIGPGGNPAYRLCPNCDQARHAVAADRRWDVTSRLRSDPWHTRAAGVPAPQPSGYPGG